MVVDDDKAILDVVTIILANEGYTVEPYATGEPLYQLSNNLPSLIILDILLAGEDGRDICKYLRTNETTKNIPIILFSAHSQDDIIYTLPGNLYDHFIAKPFDIDDLVKIVNNLVRYN
jgi:DNA-binding response OmpR family regulator